MKRKKLEPMEYLFTPKERKAFDKIFADPKYRAEARVLRTGIAKCAKVLYDLEAAGTEIMDIFLRNRTGKK